MKIIYHYENVLDLIFKEDISADIDLEQYAKEKLIVIEEVEQSD